MDLTGAGRKIMGEHLSPLIGLAVCSRRCERSLATQSWRFS